MPGSIPPNLIASLVFGVGQMTVGGGLAWHELAPKRWREWRAVLAGAGGVWFFVSGVCELIVSGMEVSRIMGGGPGLSAFNTAHAAADGVLFAATALLLVGLAAYFAARTVWSRRVAGSERGQ